MGSIKAAYVLLCLGTLVFTMYIQSDFIGFFFPNGNNSLARDAYEVDNSFSEFSSMDVTSSLQSQSRSLMPAGDNDYIRFYALQDNKYIFYTESQIATVGHLYDSDMNELASDDGAFTSDFRIEYNITSYGYYFLRIHGYYANTQGSYILYYKCETISTTGDSYEPDNSFTQYTTIDMNIVLQNQSRSIDPAGDEDFIRFYAHKNDRIIFFTESLLDTYGYLYNSNQSFLIADDQSGTDSNFKIEFVISDDGFYFLKVEGYHYYTKGPYTLYWRYERVSNYEIADIPFSWIDGITNASFVENRDDAFREVTLPFNFSFYGESYSTLYVCSNGILTFGSGTNYHANTVIPNTSVPNNIVAPFWDDLNPAATGGGKMYYKDFVDYVVVTWDGVYLFGTTIPETFQVILLNTGEIVFQYHTINSGYSCTVGLENKDGRVGISFNGSLHSGLALILTYNP